jgi:CubicO group peptidase (beta-lactamase class C family)
MPIFANDRSRAITIEQLLTHTTGFPLTLTWHDQRVGKKARAVVDRKRRACSNTKVDRRARSTGAPK